MSRSLTMAIVAISILLGLIFLLGSLMLPLSIALLLALLLYPAALWLKKLGLGRSGAAAALTILVLLLLIGTVLAALPFLVREINGLYNIVLENADKIESRIGSLLPSAVSLDDIRSSLAPSGEILQSFTLGLLSAGGIFASGVMLAILTPVCLFFFLYQGGELRESLLNITPLYMRDWLSALLDDLAGSLVGYMRGQGLVCLSQAVWHATALMLIGVPFAILLGVLVGISALVPVIGNTIMLTVTVTVALIQFDGLLPILLIVAAFGSAQLLETFFLSPMLVGSQVEIHPVLIIIAVLIGGNFGGLIGAFLALPAATVVRVTATHILQLYRNAPVFKEDRSSS